MMQRIGHILNDQTWQTSLARTEALERGRIFCGHDLGHLLDVARIAWILNLESGAGYPKDVIYAAGLLHDVGKYLQYEQKIPHHLSGSEMAAPILAAAGYHKDEILLITEAILHHRKLETDDERSLDYILYKADKLSRPCHHCPANAQCDWPKHQKNEVVQY